ncbi:hypothetical protein DMP07_04375 [Slackia faecicanis]|uniref:Uncharacterized protein n=1 Tax=Slackia faecicanis TaxID=255723 RepID=A0A3N0AH40_9ACTN|nr:hypothetical protein DMP07_04375 [Slackia faecicanis]
MVERRYLVRKAIEHRGRVVGRAFCVALGIDPDAVRPANRPAGIEYEGVMWCFRNHGSPMDRM